MLKTGIKENTEKLVTTLLDDQSFSHLDSFLKEVLSNSTGHQTFTLLFAFY